MNRAAAWSVRGVGRETREIAEEAARRAGMSLGDWLDEVVAEQAADQGVSADVLDEEDKLDAIGERLSKLSRLDRGKKASRASAEPEAPAPPAQPQPSAEEAKRAQERLEAAIAKFETRAAKNEERTAKALESVASWIEHSQADRDEERATLQSVAEKLSAFEQRSTREAERAAKEPARVEEAESDIDKRLSALARRVAAPPPPRSENRRAAERPRIDVRDSVARIARRQSELDSRDSAAHPPQPAANGWRTASVDPAVAGQGAAPRDARPGIEQPPAGRPNVASSLETLRNEIVDLSAQVERLRADEGGRTPPSGDAADLRASLAAMSRSLADLAPRNASVALEGAVGDLGQRLEAARRAGASDRLVAPVESMLEQVRETLREHDPRAAAKGLEREIRALGGKVEALTRGTAGPEVFERLRGQTEEVRNLLAAVALRPVPIERLERQMAELADRVERLATSPTPHADMARVMEQLAETRSQIERSAPAAALNSIEYRLEQLAARMDDALVRTPAIDPRPIEDLARRIDGVRAFVERQSDQRPEAAKLQATLSDIASKLDRAPAAGLEATALTGTLQDLAARLEEAFRRSASSANFDPRPFEDLARRIEAVKATMEQQGDFRPHVAKLEAALGDINSKLDRLPAPGADSKVLASSLQDMTARLEEAFRRPAPLAHVDPRPIEDLARRIEAVKVTMERQGDFRPHAAKLEAALGDISSKLDRAPAAADSKALTSTLQELTARLEDAFRRPTPAAQIDPRPLEELARRIESLRTTADFRPHAAKLEAALGEIGAKLDRAAPGADTKALTSTLQELTARLEETFRRSASSANFDPRPIEDLVRRIEAVRSTMERLGDFRPHAAKLEAALGEINSKLDRLPASGADSTTTLTTLQAQMARLEEAFRRPAAPAQIDPRPLEELARRIESVRATSDFRPHAAKLEAALGDIGAKLDRAPSAGVDTKALTSTLQEMTARLEDAFRRSASSANFDPRPIEDLVRRIDAVRAAMERQGDFRPHAAKLESALGEINSKLDRLPVAGADSTVTLTALQAQMARLEEAFRRPAPPAQIDPRPLEELARRIESVRVASDFRPHAAKLEAALGDIGAKLDRPAAGAGADMRALTSTLQELTARLEEVFRRSASSANFDPRPIEDLVRRIDAVRATMEQQGDFRPHAAKLEAALGEINSKLDRQPTSGADATAMLGTLQTQMARLEEALHRPAAPAQIDTRPLDELARRIESVRATVERQADFGPHAAKMESALGDINAKLDRPATDNALTSTLQELTARLDEVFRQPPPAPRLDLRPIEELARRIEGVRATVERKEDFRPHAERLEAALSDISSKLDRPPPAALDSTELTNSLQELTARLDEAFRRPPPEAKIDPEPLEELGRRIDDVRATIERTADYLPDAAKLDAALADIGAKLDSQAFSPDDLRALTSVMQDLAARFDDGGIHALDTKAIERMLRDMAARPVEVDTAPIEAMLRDLGEKFAASTAPVAIDTGPIERMLSRVDAKLDAVARAPMDVRPLEQAVRDLHAKLDFRDAPPIDARIIEQAADLLAKRLDLRDGGAVDADALFNQISEIHGRLDQLSATTQSNAGLERTVADLLDELDSMRQTLRSSTSARQDATPLVGDIAELRAEQVNSDRRTQARLGEVQDILEKLVGRLGRIEDDVARADEDEPEPRRAAPGISPRPAIKDAIGDPDFDEAALRSIPDRVLAPTNREKFGQAGRVGAATADKSQGTTNFLPQAGEGGPPRPRIPEVESVPPPLPPAPQNRNSEINAHIAAARRAAQAALLESAAKEEEAASSRPQAAEAGSRRSPVKLAREFLAARRRPLLLGVAFLAVVTTLAVVGLRGGGHPPAQKSELPKPLQSAPPVAAVPGETSAPHTAASVDYSPVGTVAPAPPATAPATGFRPAPADMVAAIPTNVSSSLRAAATAGDTGAETEMALRYIEGKSLTRDPKIAARWFEQAATQGLPFAQYRLAALYEKGTGVARDTALAKSWYLKAANSGNARAMHNLAVLFAEDGGAGKPDYAEAAQWFRRAGELGIRDSQFNLGVLLGRGLGVPQDLGQSWMWFSLAARQGDADAAKKRDEVAAKLDAAASAAAAKALADFKARTPDPTANEAPGGWEAKTDAPQSTRPSTPAPVGAVPANGAHG